MKKVRFSNSLYWILILFFAQFLLSFGRISFVDIKNYDWWFLVFIVTFHLSTLIALEKIKILVVENSKKYMKYKLHLFRMFDAQKDHLDQAKAVWIQNENRKFSQWLSWRLYELSVEMKIEWKETTMDDVNEHLKNQELITFFEENGYTVENAKNRKTKQAIKKLYKSYHALVSFYAKFDNAERRYRDGYFTKTYFFSIEKTIVNLFSFLVPFFISIYSYIQWTDTNIFSRLIITLVIFIINLIVCIPQISEMYNDSLEYWKSIEDALVEIHPRV